jgi:tRNA modification GTPase
VPGTTRDVLRQQVHLDGLPLNLIDTAGLRATVDVVEVEGVRRARNEMAQADRVLYVLDIGAGAGTGDSESWAADLGELPPGVPVTLVFNKIDLTDGLARLDETAAPPRIFLSARTGAGLNLLRTHLKAAVGYRETESGAFAARRRHVDALQRARAHVQNAADTLSTTRAFELFAEDLRLAQHALGEITGEFTSDDLLGEIFGSFCIGK